MGSLAVTEKEREGAEIVYGAEECRRHCMELLEEIGFPRGVLPLKELEECGRVKETGFVWMKQKGPYENFFAGTNTRVRFEAVVTGYVEKNRMNKMNGVRSKQMLLWVPITEMSLIDPAGKKIYFKSAVGIGRSFPISAFMEEEQKKIEGENNGD